MLPLRSGWSPLLLAASNGHIDLVKIFLDVNARVDVFDQEARYKHSLVRICLIFDFFFKVLETIRSQYFSGRPCTWQLNPGMRTSARCCWAKMLMSTGIRPKFHSRIVSLFLQQNKGRVDTSALRGVQGVQRADQGVGDQAQRRHRRHQHGKNNFPVKG